jgi:hypothetical protein
VPRWRVDGVEVGRRGWGEGTGPAVRAPIGVSDQAGLRQPPCHSRPSPAPRCQGRATAAVRARVQLHGYAGAAEELAVLAVQRLEHAGLVQEVDLGRRERGAWQGRPRESMRSGARVCGRTPLQQAGPPRPAPRSPPPPPPPAAAHHAAAAAVVVRVHAHLVELAVAREALKQRGLVDVGAQVLGGWREERAAAGWARGLQRPSVQGSRGAC